MAPPPVVTLPRAPEVEVPKSLFIDHTSPALAVNWPALYPTGFQVPLGAGGAASLNVSQYRRVNILMAATKAHSAILYMGKWQPNTLVTSFQWTPDAGVHSFDVIGPEISLLLTSPFDKATPAEMLQLWLYLSA